MHPPDRVNSAIASAERLTLFGLLAVGVVVRLGCAYCAGPLWRDEAHSVLVVGDPSIPLWWDSFPVLWNGLLSIVCACVGENRGTFDGSRDFELRCLGLFLGIIVLPVAVWAPSPGTRAIPWMTITLFALNPTLVACGTQVRGYALGCAFGLLTAGLFARVATRRSSASTWLALAAAQLLAVQSMYANVPLVAAGSVAALMPMLLQRRYTGIACLAAAAALSALSTLPYVLFAFPRMNEWAVLVKFDRAELETVVLAKAFALVHIGVNTLLGVFVALALCEAWFARDRRPAAGRGFSRRNLTRLFAIVFLSASWALVVGYVLFLKVPTAPRYFLPLVMVTAFSFDLFRSPRPSGTFGDRIRVAYLPVSIMLATLLAPLAVNASWVKVSNVDWASRLVDSSLRPGDLVLVHPWYLGTSFLRYSKHRDDVVLLPPMRLEDITRGYLKILNMKKAGTPMHPDWADLERRIARGGTVWVVALPTWEWHVVLAKQGQILQSPWNRTAAGMMEWTNGIELAAILTKSEASMLRHASPDAGNVCDDELVEVYEFRKSR